MNNDEDDEDEILEASCDANSEAEILDAEGVAHVGDGELPLDAGSHEEVLHVAAAADDDDDDDMGQGVPNGSIDAAAGATAQQAAHKLIEGAEPGMEDWLDGAPLLQMWRWTSDGAICGYVHGKEGFRDGELMTTSVVPPEGRFDTYVVTGSGTAYRLGERASGSGGMRRSSRAVGKDSLLDAFADAPNSIRGAPGLRYAVGGAETGGVAAEKIMRSSFSVLDDNLVYLRAQYQTARRVVLLSGDTPVAASVVEVHPEQSVLEVPILAAARSQRIRGYGSILVATLKELGARLRLRILVVSATQESMRFWLRQGLHTPAHCQGAMRAALRKMDTKAMAAAVPDSLVDEIAIACTPDEARDRLEQWRDLCDQPLLYAPSVGVAPGRLRDGRGRARLRRRPR